MLIQLSQQKRKHPELTFTCDSPDVVGGVCYKGNKKDAGLLTQESSMYFNFKTGFESLSPFLSSWKCIPESQG